MHTVFFLTVWGSFALMFRYEQGACRLSRRTVLLCLDTNAVWRTLKSTCVCIEH